ncbi:hypothetical protein ACXWOJ_09075, partial [Streptococcus pyogenes]
SNQAHTCLPNELSLTLPRFILNTSLSTAAVSTVFALQPSFYPQNEAIVVLFPTACLSKLRDVNL